MAGLGLPTYNTPNQLGRAKSFYGQASGSYGAMQKKRPQREKSVGGGIMAAGGGAATGAMVGAELGSSLSLGFASGGPAGAFIGTGVGALGYALS